MYAKFNDDGLWNEKALVHWKSDNDNPKNNNRKNNVGGDCIPVSGSNKKCHNGQSNIYLFVSFGTLMSSRAVFSDGQKLKC